MPSDAAKLRKQMQKGAARKRTGAKDVVDDADDEGGAAAAAAQVEEGGAAAMEQVNAQMAALSHSHQRAEDRSCTGVLSSHKLSRDLHVENFSLTFHGSVLVQDTVLELNYGRRYGLLGLNGSGKSTLLNVIGAREIPMPEVIDVHHLSSEVAATDLSALQAVCAVDAEKAKLEAEVDLLIGVETDEAQDRLTDIYERLDELGGELAEKRAGEILFGLGFTKEMQAMKTREFSGGWRMRIALARALYMSPSLLLLDEPTNHLDLEACVWLEERLAQYNRILLIVSHSQDFLNNVCTNIIHLSRGKLVYYTGNYDSYVRARAEKEENQTKQYNREQDEIAHMKEYIARFGHGSAKLARQAQSKEKTLEKMVRSGLTEKVEKDRTLRLQFIPCGKLPPPVMQFVNVDFGYSPQKMLFRNLDFGVDLDSRIALVGPNGAGKSTLLKLMVDEIIPTNGAVRKHSHLRIARYHQHFVDQLNLEQSPLEYMMEQFPEMKEVEAVRRTIGRFGITGQTQVAPMRMLSDGQKSRVMFAWICLRQPHMLLLDEPTNHLDMETIDSLAEAINEWDGGLVLVSHDFRLIGQVAQEIWICEKQTVTRWPGDILSYKNKLRKKAGLAATRA